MTSKTRTLTNSPTARKVVGSLGVLGAAAAVAGMGTFGSFTDSTTPVATTIQSGTLSIDLSQQGYSVPVTTTGFVPGDSLTRAVNLVNDGNSALGSVTLSSAATASSILTTDGTNGLQLTVKKCSVAWIQGGTAQAPTYTCSGTETLMGTGPVVTNMPLTGASALNVGGTDYLTFSIALPASADNSFQNKSASLSLTFTGTQRTGSAR
jgi:predicted ribosomally synthesized peptide with SipW-like signal peptide